MALRTMNLARPQKKPNLKRRITWYNDDNKASEFLPARVITILIIMES